MPHNRWEKFFIKQGFEFVAGIDEVGRGPLAGPVVASAVILPRNHRIKGLDDSKKLTEKKRRKLFLIIKKRAVSIGVGIVCEKTIDRINIAQASFCAMRMAYESLTPPPDVLLIDGKCEIKFGVPQKCIIRGDSICESIAAASIIAKVIRDKIMDKYDLLFPAYDFKKHKGYGTRRHLAKINKFGPSPAHRMSFRIDRHETPNPLDFEQMQLVNFRRKGGDS